MDTHTGTLIASLFQSIGSDDAKLARVEFLVLLSGIFLILAFILDTYRFRTKNGVINTILLILDTINIPLQNYTLGLIQNAPFTNEILALWAVLLNNAQSDTTYITSYSIVDQNLRRRTELRELLVFLLIANLIFSVQQDLVVPLWMLWAVRPLLVFSRIYYYDVALQSYSHGRNSEFLAEYLNNDCLRNSKSEPAQADMSGYNYIIWGENKQKIESDAPNDQFKLEITDQTNCITVAKIWGCDGRLLSLWDKENKIKDVCLSYAFYKILRCQTENLRITRECYHKMQNLVFKCILHNKHSDDERVFRIFETETAFLNDYCRTRYPLSIWYGFPIISIVTFVTKLSIFLMLAINLHRMQFHQNETTHYISKFNVDHFITYLLLSMIMLKEIWEILLYSFSDWNKVKIVCQYFREHWFMRNPFFEHIVWYLCTKVLVRRWCKRMSQYNLLEKFDYSPWVKRILHYITFHVISKPMEGGKLLSDIKIYREVKMSIAEALHSMKQTDEIMNFMPPVYECPIRDNLKWACSQQTCSHLILVWHIATSMCEIELSISQEPKNLWYQYPLYWIRKICSKKPFLVDLKSLEGDLRTNYIAANSVSRYCAYLLISAHELLPDNKIFPRLTFKNTVSNARKILGSSDSLERTYRKLMEIGRLLQEQRDHAPAEAIIINAEQSQEANPKIGVVEMGARLGYQLINNMEPDDRWKMLSEFWANLLLYLAPNFLSGGHQTRLTKGGEFITLLWALFTHCGIFDREKEVNNAANEEDDSQQRPRNEDDIIG